MPFRPADLRRVATRALAGFGVRPERLRLRLAAYNTTFEVHTAAGERYALRVTRPGPDRAHVLSECAWVLALDQQTELRVSTPLVGPDGHVVEVDGRCCVLTRWVDGAQRRKWRSLADLRALGVAMAQLHAHASSWSPPPGWGRPRLDDLWDHHPSPLDRLPSDAAEVFSRCEAPLRALLVALHREPTHLIHADLHGGNVRFLPGHRVGVLDFDDCGLGHPAQDVAICAFYLRTQPNAEALVAALREGYTSLRPWPAPPEQLEALVVARALTLCAGLLAHPDPALHAWLDRVLPRWTRLASGWLARGVA